MAADRQNVHSGSDKLAPMGMPERMEADGRQLELAAVRDHSLLRAFGLRISPRKLGKRAPHLGVGPGHSSAATPAAPYGERGDRSRTIQAGKGDRAPPWRVFGDLKRSPAFVCSRERSTRYTTRLPKPPRHCRLVPGFLLGGTVTAAPGDAAAEIGLDHARVSQCNLGPTLDQHRALSQHRDPVA